MINRIPVHLIWSPQNDFQYDNVHLLQQTGEGDFFYEEGKKECDFAYWLRLCKSKHV